MTTEEVLNHHLESFSAGNVDMVMQDYTADSVLILPDQTLRGLEAIRAAFTEFFGGLFKPGTYEFSMDRVDVEGPIAYIIWHSQNQGVAVKQGTDTFYVANGKIAIQTFAAYME